MTGSIPLLYLHYPNDLMGTRPWQTDKSGAHCSQAAPGTQTRARVAREERYKFILIPNHHLHIYIVIIIVLLLLLAPLHSALGTRICPAPPHTQPFQQIQSGTWWNVCNFCPHKPLGWYQSSKQHWENTCLHTDSFTIYPDLGLSKTWNPKAAKIHTDPNSQTIHKGSFVYSSNGIQGWRFSSYTVLESNDFLMYFPDFGFFYSPDQWRTTFHSVSHPVLDIFLLQISSPISQTLNDAAKNVYSWLKVGL